MSRNPLKLKIAYLYPDFLDGFCDISNINAFVQRAQQRDIDITVYEIERNDRIQASKYDFYYIGGNNLTGLNSVVKYIYQNKDELKVAAMANVPMLAIACGYMLFSNFYQLYNRPRIEGLKILDTEAYMDKKREFKNISGTCPFLNDQTIAGYKNSNIICNISNLSKNDLIPFVEIKKGVKKLEYEGVRINNVIGTNITSALLAQNPHFTDFLISKALQIKYKCAIPLTQLYDDIEWYSHNYILDSIK